MPAPAGCGQTRAQASRPASSVPLPCILHSCQTALLRMGVRSVPPFLTSPLPCICNEAQILPMAYKCCPGLPCLPLQPHVPALLHSPPSIHPGLIVPPTQFHLRTFALAVLSAGTLKLSVLALVAFFSSFRSQWRGLSQSYLVPPPSSRHYCISLGFAHLFSA